MKNIITSLICIGTLLLSSCSDTTTDDVSQITNYAVITIHGESELFAPLDAPYNDEGATSEIEGTEIETTTVFYPGAYNELPGVDTSVSDKYLIEYSAVNTDGFIGTEIRTVWVAPPTGDFINSIEGLYTSNVQRTPDFEVEDQYTDLAYVSIFQIDTNVYEITHGIGGYYDIGRAYGPGFQAAGATITVNDIPTNDFTLTEAVIPFWGDIFTISDFKVDATTKTITFTSSTDSFDNGIFKVQLTQVEL